MTRFLAERSHNQAPRYDREGLAAWATERFHTVDRRRRAPAAAPARDRGAPARAGPRALPGRRGSPTSSIASSTRPIRPASGRDRQAVPPPTPRPWPTWPPGPTRPWASRSTADELGRDVAATRSATLLVNALDAKHRPEMREMEKVAPAPDPRLELDGTPPRHGPPPQLDRAARLRPDRPQGRVQARGHEDLRRDVERHRRQVTDLIFRVEQFDPEFLSYLGSRWQLDRAQTIHQSAESQLAAVAGRRRDSPGSRTPPSPAASSRPRRRREPVRNVGKKVGRNDPCPCGSGKKFKACCMRKQSPADPF